MQTGKGETRRGILKEPQRISDIRKAFRSKQKIAEYRIVVFCIEFCEFKL